MSNSIERTGTVHLIEETKTYGDNGFQKRLMVIDVPDGQYSNKLPIEAINDKCGMFDGIREGDTVTAHLNLRSNEWKDRFFLSLQCWKIDSQASAPVSDRPPLPADDAVNDDGLEDDVPFW